MSIDPNTKSNYEDFVTTSADIDWFVDFDRKTILGSVLYSVRVLKSDCQKLILDCEHIKCQEVLLNDVVVESTASNDMLIIPVGDRKIDDVFKVKIKYETTEKCEALQWLTPEQTSGGKFPYLYSQCQPIYARTIVPSQDTPSVKFTYKSHVTNSLNLQVLMSALPLEKENDCFHFSQPVPIPAYLLAIVVGNITSVDIGPRVKVWSEAENVSLAAKDFCETENMLKEAEKLVGEYKWGRYDFLVLPPSFPYGGMENPNITFVSPSLLTGDKSGASVIAHELAHSWTGNLVTNCSWEHFWLNEGFTVFLERKIVQALETPQVAALEAIVGLNCLEDSIKAFSDKKPELTALIPNLKGIHPDDAFSSVPYEKGSNLLVYLQNLLGGHDAFMSFLRSYIERFAGKSIDTGTWKSYLYQFFSDKKDVLDSVDWESWFYSPGSSCVVDNKFDDSLLQVVNTVVDKWLSLNEIDVDAIKNDDTIKSFKPLTTLQKVKFFDTLYNEADKSALTLQHVEAMYLLYELSQPCSAEIRFRWCRIGIHFNHEPTIAMALDFISTMGRMKFTLPIYRKLVENPNTRQRAISQFQNLRHTYHAILVTQFEKDLDAV